MWSTIIEKAWAKIAGNYELANGGYLESGLRSMTGVPVFTYWGDDILNTTASAKLWATMKAADDVGYLLSAAVYQTDTSSVKNQCGIIQSHAYSVISVFKMS
jgi:calpain-5